MKKISPAHSPVIAHLLSNRWNSAITEYAVHAAQALQLAGFRQVMVALRGSAGAWRASAAGLRVVEVDGFSMMHLPEIARVINKEFLGGESLKAVLVYGGPETFISKWIKGMNPGIKVVRFRGDDRDAAAKSGGMMQKLSQGHVDILLTPSDFIARRLDSRARKVEPAIDLDRIHREKSRDPGPAGRSTCVILGRLDPVKGHGLFFRVFARMLARKSQDRYTLAVVGEPENLSVEALEAQARDAGLTVGRDVNFTSARVDDINSLLSSACAGVVCSTGSEIICRVAQEFLVCGTPIVISGVGSLREIPLPCDGFDYGGLRSPEIEDGLWNFLEKSRAESREVREARAGTSAKRFGLGAMASSLSRVMAELGIYPI